MMVLLVLIFIITQEAWRTFDWTSIAIADFLYLIKDLKQERYMQYTRLYHRFAMWVLYTYLQYLGLGGMTQ
mgnify:CR=1 FL=1